MAPQKWDFWRKTSKKCPTHCSPTHGDAILIHSPLGGVPLGKGGGKVKTDFLKIFFLIFLIMFNNHHNIIGDVSGWSRRINNIFIIFEKKYFPNIFFQKNPKKKGEGGEDPPPRGGNGSRLRPSPLKPLFPLVRKLTVHTVRKLVHTMRKHLNCKGILKT